MPQSADIEWVENIICNAIVLPDTSVSFNLYLQPLFGNVFKFLELRSKIPVLCAFSKTLSINNTSLDEFDDEKLGEDEFETPPGPPGSITQTDISIIYFRTLHSNWVSPTPAGYNTFIHFTIPTFLVSIFLNYRPHFVKCSPILAWLRFMQIDHASDRHIFVDKTC